MAPRIPKRNARFIDSDAEADRGRAALEMLRGYAGAPSQASVMRPGALGAYEGGELAGMAEMLIPGASLAKGALGAALAGVIKPRGGNWISGAVESSISNLLRREYGPESIQQQRDTLEFARRRGYDDEMIRELERAVQQREAPNVLNRWIEGPLTKYIKRDMATPEDPVRKLAEEGILHYDPIANDDIRSGADYVRQLARDRGFPGVKLGKSDLAQRWENLTDIHLEPNYVGKGDPLPFPTRQNKSFSQDMEWLERVRNAPEESQLFGSYLDTGMAREAGFPHLVDELSNSLNPDSGLPRNLLLRPEQMQQMGIEKAVRHVDAINKWRAAQQAAANAELANKAMVIREYAENNPKGLRWVELRPSETLNPEYELKQVEGKNGVYWDLRKPGQSYGHTTHTELEAIRASNRAELEKQLKYEGDTMGHCVGGYCEDVLAGGSRIFSLRDAKGEPHVTVEVEPSTKSLSGELLNDIEPGIWDTIVKENGHSDLRGWLKTNRPDVWEKLQTHSIAQIKGKQNLAPKDDYLPFVQDFVRNSPLGGGWSRVGDLRNTGLRKVGDRYVTLDELKDVSKTPDGFPIDYEPLDDRPEWKDGGIVEFPKITPKAMLNRVISAYNSL